MYLAYTSNYLVYYQNCKPYFCCDWLNKQKSLSNSAITVAEFLLPCKLIIPNIIYPFSQE